jgi:hypothetical protein
VKNFRTIFESFEASPEETGMIFSDGATGRRRGMAAGVLAAGVTALAMAGCSSSSSSGSSASAGSLSGQTLTVYTQAYAPPPALGSPS